MLFVILKSFVFLYLRYITVHVWLTAEPGQKLDNNNNNKKKKKTPKIITK